MAEEKKELTEERVREIIREELQAEALERLNSQATLGAERLVEAIPLNSVPWHTT